VLKPRNSPKTKGTCRVVCPESVGPMTEKVVDPKRAVPVMEGWSSGVAVQAEIPNHRKLRRSRAGVVSVAEKARRRAGQVSDEKTNMCEPLLTHRNVQTASKPGPHLSPGRRARPAGCVPSQGAACVWPWWCPVYRWRELVAGAGMEQENLSPRYRLGRSLGLVQPPGRREGGPRAAETARGRVPRRGTGADRPVVAMKAL